MDIHLDIDMDIDIRLQKKGTWILFHAGVPSVVLGSNFLSSTVSL